MKFSEIQIGKLYTLEFTHRTSLTIWKTSDSCDTTIVGEFQKTNPFMIISMNRLPEMGFLWIEILTCSALGWVEIREDTIERFQEPPQ